MALLVFWVTCTPAAAQQPDDPPGGRIEVGVGGGFLGGAALGAEDAALRANEPSLRPFRLFAAESRLGGAPLVHARVGYTFSRRFGVEGGVAFSRPELRTSLSADAEGAPALTIVERVDQYFVEAGLVVMLEQEPAGGLLPFVMAGGGYLRQLHEGLTVIEHGVLYYAGGGVKQRLLSRDAGFIRAAGLRAGARLTLMTGGISFSGPVRPHAAVSASVFFGF